MDEAIARAARRTIVGKYLTDVSLLAKDSVSRSPG